MDILLNICNGIADFAKTDVGTYTTLGVAALSLLLAVIYMIRFRVFTVWDEALFLRRSVSRASSRGESPVLDGAPKRIARLSGNLFTVERITGRSTDSPKGSFYVTSAVILSAVNTAVFSTEKTLVFYLAVILLIVFAYTVGRRAYKVLEDACLSYNTLKCTDVKASMLRLVEAMETLPDTQRTVYTLKEMLGALAHAQATAEADKLDELVERYCHTMNECMLDQLSRMGEVLQDTIDSQNELRKSMRLLLNDLAAARTGRKI